MSFPDLPALILENITLAAVKNPDFAAEDRSRMFAGAKPPPRGLHPEHFHTFIADERVKQTHRIAAAADTCDQIIGELSFPFEDLPARFPSDHGLKVAHEHRIRVRSGNRADQIIGAPNVSNPV